MTVWLAYACWMASNDNDKDIIIHPKGRAGSITLNRPSALNALTHDMCIQMERALVAWHYDKAVDLVTIQGAGERAFCAGGDIVQMYQTARDGDFEYGRQFWQDEYRLNSMIANYPKPFVAFMDGLVMGGGVGVSIHGTRRIATQNTQFAMPECAIGLVPDVGGNFWLARAPGRIGEYLAATGARLNAADCIYAGIADGFIPAARLSEAIEVLNVTGNLEEVTTFFQEPSEPSMLAENQGAIDTYFSLSNALEIVIELERDGSPFAKTSAKKMRVGCPLSVMAAIELVRMAREVASLNDVLALEYRFTSRSAEHGDFIEGIRAQIIDKDRSPKWRYPTLETLPESAAKEMLEPLSNGDLELREYF